MTDDEYTLAIALAAQQAIDAKEAEQPLMDEVPPAEELPEDPEKAQLREKAELLDAYEPMLRKLGSGELVLTEAPPAIPDPGPIAGYRERATSPDAPEIVASMRLYQEQLATVDPEAAQRLEDDPEFFNQTFDRFRELRPAPVQPEPVPPRRDPQELERILAAREIRKDAARSERAGIVTGGSEAFGREDRATGRNAEVERLKAAIRRNPSDSDLAVALAKALGLDRS